MPRPAVPSPYTVSADDLMVLLAVGDSGLADAVVVQRRQQYGPNRLPAPQPPHLLFLFVRQFGNPLIYILLGAASLSAWERDWSDAGFISAVLLINAVIGTYQEYQAARNAAALSRLVEWQATVIRDGDVLEIPAEELVPGDLVVLEAGIKVPADIRLTMAAGMEVDEAILTGESLPVRKTADTVLPADTTLADQTNMVFAGTLVARGQGQGVVVATGTGTALGQLSLDSEAVSATPPLLLRMAHFTRTLALVIAGSSLAIAAVGLLSGQSWRSVLMLAVALAVAAIPEGLPAALTIALAVATRRMAARKVIVRHLVSVEALGSCTYIASDKTGTLTVNQLAVAVAALPGEPRWTVTGEAGSPVGTVLAGDRELPAEARPRLDWLCTTAVLASDGTFGRRPDGTWHGHGDAVDVALLVMAHKAGITRASVQATHHHLGGIPFDPEYRFSAALERFQGETIAYVKGAPEQLVTMCRWEAGPAGRRPIDADAVMAGAAALAGDGYRVLALAAGPVSVTSPGEFALCHLDGLVFLGLVGMIDPLRPEARQAVAESLAAGVEVAMVTGDHPVTALAIARGLGLARDETEIATGAQLHQASREGGEAAIAGLVAGRHVFARVEPRQKLEIVTALRRSGHFVAVTGDGANDVPALRAAHVSVAMGQGGTDIAREAADLILADDNFASIVAGIREGRIAYANIRKVIFLLVSTGAGGLVLFLLAAAYGLPLPMLPVQLLWLNLVTDSVQHIALSFDPGEGDELSRPPRSPDEPIFDRLMIQRLLLTGVYMGGAACALMAWELALGVAIPAARNAVVFLMVLFENASAFNSRSERRSLFRQSLWNNPSLIAAVAGSLAIHVAATYWPPTQRLLSLQPLSWEDWLDLPLLALGLIALIEVAMWLDRRQRAKQEAGKP